MNKYYTKDSCPVCEGSRFEFFLECVDYTVSKEKFKIVKCLDCDMHFTNPIPYEDHIGEYYKSESYISHSSTNKGIINKLYQIVRKRTLKQKVGLVSRLAKGKMALDIGAGTGHFLNAMTEAGFDALGLEPDNDARALAKKTFNVDIQAIDELCAQQESTFDVITMWHVLEHVYNLKKDLDQIINTLKEDGTLIVAVPNRDSYDAKYYQSFWAAYDLPIHLYHFNPKNIEQLFEQYDMKVEEVLPMKFDAFYVSMLSEKYKHGNLFNAFVRGLLSNVKAKKGTYSSQIYILKKKS